MPLLQTGRLMGGFGNFWVIHGAASFIWRVTSMDGKNSKQVDLVGSESIPKANVGETATILDKFYSVPENLNIPIWRALRVAVLQIAGRPKREIDAEMETARSVIRLYMERCEKEKIGCEHLR